jgi:hypothetical protein
MAHPYNHLNCAVIFAPPGWILTWTDIRAKKRDGFIERWFFLSCLGIINGRAPVCRNCHTGNGVCPHFCHPFLSLCGNQPNGIFFSLNMQYL